jgi:hypothetical protein
MVSGRATVTRALTDRGKDVEEPMLDPDGDGPGGALAQRVCIHQLHQTAPRLAGLIEDLYGQVARDTATASTVRRGQWIRP